MELDTDLQARQEARDLLQRAQRAQAVLEGLNQEQLDRAVEAIALAFSREAESLARLAVEETGFGNPEDKAEKNRFASLRVWQAVKDMRCVGVLDSTGEKLWQIGVPVGVIAAIVPSTNPTSTVCYKAIIALKAGNAIVFSPHPKALGCTLAAARICREAAQGAGLPPDAVGCLTVASLEGCRELMQGKQTRLILATGGPGMVRSAYASGKPAIGVGAGNGPAYIHESADIPHALECILKSKTFDNGTVCASEQSIIVTQAMEAQVRRQASAMGFYFLDTREAGALAKLLFRPDGSLNPAIVGRSAQTLAKMAGFSLPDSARVLVAREQEAGPTRPYSMEKLCPVLAFFVMPDEASVLSKAVEVLRHEGSGHTFALHARDKGVVERFAGKIPVSRFLVNTPAALGGIGATTALFPALTLGCGAVGGSSTSNNISPMDLINIRRVAWDTGEERPSSGEERPSSGEVSEEMVQTLARQILQRLG